MKWIRVATSKLKITQIQISYRFLCLICHQQVNTNKCNALTNIAFPQGARTCYLLFLSCLGGAGQVS